MHIFIILKDVAMEGNKERTKGRNDNGSWWGEEREKKDESEKTNELSRSKRVTSIGVKRITGKVESEQRNGTE